MSDIRLDVYRRNIETSIARAVTVEVKEISHTYIAGETMGGHKAVYIDSGVAYLANSNDVTILNKPIGITKGAATIGSPVDVIFLGVLNGFGTLSPGVYFVGANGDITTTQAGSIYIEVGRAIDNDKMLVNVKLIVRR